MSENILRRPDRNKNIILYVDDEEKNLDSFKIVFRKDYDIKVAKSAEEGFKILQNNEVRLVITDQRMPNMTGVEFLEKIAHSHPDITRIILTGYSDVEAIISAINKGRVFRYITKPWNKKELKETIDYALESYKLKVENKQLLNKIKKTRKHIDELVYRAAHDLRAPLASVLGLLNLAKKESDPEKLYQYLDLQEKSVRKLDELLRDIIQFSRNTHLELKVDGVNLEEMITESFLRHEYFKQSQQIEKSCEIEQNHDFLTDKFRFEIILNNLISNAIRYSDLEKPDPYIRVKAKVKPNEAEIIVVDNGLGIKENLKNQIFQMFFKGNDENAEGAGLGLFIVKETVEKLSGEIFLESVEGKGSEFRVIIPNLLKPKD